MSSTLILDNLTADFYRKPGSLDKNHWKNKMVWTSCDLFLSELRFAMEEGWDNSLLDTSSFCDAIFLIKFWFFFIRMKQGFKGKKTSCEKRGVFLFW